MSLPWESIKLANLLDNLDLNRGCIGYGVDEKWKLWVWSKQLYSVRWKCHPLIRESLVKVITSLLVYRFHGTNAIIIFFLIHLILLLIFHFYLFIVYMYLFFYFHLFFIYIYFYFYSFFFFSGHLFPWSIRWSTISSLLVNLVRSWGSFDSSVEQTKASALLWEAVSSRYDTKHWYWIGKSIVLFKIC